MYCVECVLLLMEWNDNRTEMGTNVTNGLMNNLNQSSSWPLGGDELFFQASSLSVFVLSCYVGLQGRALIFAAYCPT